MKKPQKPQPDARQLRFMRLKGMVRKESLQIIRDPSSIAIAFLLPLILLLLFGYGVSLDAEQVPVALVVEDSSPESSSFTAGFTRSRFFDPMMFQHIQKAEQAVIRGDADAIIWLRQGFGEDLLSGDTPTIQVIVNGVNANNARIIQGYIQGVWIKWLEKYARSAGRSLNIPVVLEQRVWYNPALRSRNFLVPGLIAVIMTLIGALLTAMVVAREWERGTMEALMVTPIQVKDLLLGKLIPYFGLGMGGMALSVAMAVWLFEVPLRGSVWVLFASAALFLIVALGMGLLISTLAKNQFVAGQAAIVSTFLPAFILSGFIFDINSMPAPIQGLTHVIAASYFVSILQTVFLAGNVWPVILSNAAALFIMAVILLALVRKRTRKKLE